MYVCFVTIASLYDVFYLDDGQSAFTPYYIVSILSFTILFHDSSYRRLGSPDKYRGDMLLRWSTGMKSRGMAQGSAYGMNAGNEIRMMAAWLLSAACDRSYRTSCNGHLALRPSEQIGWQGRRRSRSPVVWREQTVNKKQRFLSSFQIGKGISCRQLVAPALEYILRWRMNIYCDGGWIYTAMADEYILRWQMQIAVSFPDFTRHFFVL